LKRGLALRVFATRWFARFARAEQIGDDALSEAIARAEKRAIDADLGGHLIKQRVARLGGGRSGGYRTLIAYVAKRRGVFLYGFAKREMDNIDSRELADLKRLAGRFSIMTHEEIEVALRANEIKELRFP
jgi:hypothetical protein